MQEMCEDYYDLGIGCCLLCPRAEPGCLCTECSCTSCFWYTPPEESGEFDEYGQEKGSCDKKAELIAEAKEKNMEKWSKIGKRLGWGVKNYDGSNQPKDPKQKQLLGEKKWVK